MVKYVIRAEQCITAQRGNRLTPTVKHCHSTCLLPKSKVSNFFINCGIYPPAENDVVTGAELLFSPIKQWLLNSFLPWWFLWMCFSHFRSSKHTFITQSNSYFLLTTKHLKSSMNASSQLHMIQVTSCFHPGETPESSWWISYHPHILK